MRDFFNLELLREHFEIEILAFQGDVNVELPHGITLTLIPRQTPPLIRRLLSRFRTYVINGYSENMARAIQERASQNALLWCSRLSMGKYLRAGKKAGLKTLLDQHNVESDILFHTILRHPFLWHQLGLAIDCRIQERRFCREADAVTCVSERDAGLIRLLAPKTPTYLLPNTIDSAAYRTIQNSSGKTILFLGTLNYYPNLEGLEWFIEKVLPILKSRMPHELPPILVAGSHPSPQLIKKLEEANIQLISNPQDMLPLLQNAAVVAIPLLSGGGTRFKILEAMAAGRAIVSTTKGAEGLPLKNGDPLEIGDSPFQFSEKIVKILEDRNLQTTLGKHAAEWVDQNFDWRRFREKMKIILDQVVFLP